MTLREQCEKHRPRFLALVGGEEREAALLKSVEAKLGHMINLKNQLLIFQAVENDPAARETDVGRMALAILKVMGPPAAAKPVTSSAPAVTRPTPQPPKPVSVAEKKEKAKRAIGEYQKLEGRAREAWVKENIALLEDPDVALSRMLLNYVRANKNIPGALILGIGVTTKNAGAR